MSEDTIENITNSDSNFAPTCVDHYILRDINYFLPDIYYTFRDVNIIIYQTVSIKGHCLINNNISILKKSNKYIHFSHGKSMAKRFNYRFYIRQLFIWIFKTN